MSFGFPSWNIFTTFHSVSLLPGRVEWSFQFISLRIPHKLVMIPSAKSKLYDIIIFMPWLHTGEGKQFAFSKLFVNARKKENLKF